MISRIRNRSVSSTALVLFTGDVRREERRKRLPRRFLSSIHSSLVDQIQTIEGCDVYICGDGPALEGTVGRMPAGDRPVSEQIATAVSELFNGYERVLLLAGDVCGLQREHIAAAVQHLDGEGARATVGRSFDGGFYLAAFNRPPEIDWAQLPWFQPTIGRELINALEVSGFSVAVVEQLADIDDAGDARRILGTFKRIAPQLRSILFAALTGFIETFVAPRQMILATALYRRPPPSAR